MIISVNGFEEAKAYPVMFGSTELLMDSTRDVFYVKAVDQIGKYTISTYEFRQVENERPLSAADVVTKEQFDALNQKLDQVLNNLAQAQPTSTPAPAQAKSSLIIE